MKDFFIILLICFLIYSENTFCQSRKTEIFTATEVMPEPAGGMQEFVKYISNNLFIPKSVGQKDSDYSKFTKCYRYLRFIVETDGTLHYQNNSDCELPEVQQMFRNLINNAPKWKPGTNGGKSVKVLYHLPFNCITILE
jgi:periplasmic protein TonB